jgi:hypothetical protein
MHLTQWVPKYTLRFISNTSRTPPLVSEKLNRPYPSLKICGFLPPENKNNFHGCKISETSASLYPTRRCHIPEDSNLDNWALTFSQRFGWGLESPGVRRCIVGSVVPDVKTDGLSSSACILDEGDTILCNVGEPLTERHIIKSHNTWTPQLVTSQNLSILDCPAVR